jgi:hypothetical protein
MSVAITRKDELGTNNNPQRVDAELELTVARGASRSSTTDEQIRTKIALFGPGDIASLDPSIVIRTEPVNNSIDFEPNFLAFIEFAQPDFPWRYTPARASDENKLRPWIFLIVLTDDGKEYEGPVNTDPSKPLPWITVKSVSKLPNPTQIWAWAHLQVLNKIEDGKIESELTNSPERFISRIICPRKLEPNLSYAAFLVPSFETGRLAGLGENITEQVDGLKSSWSNGNVQVKIPFYYSFKFKTGIEGDFESLVRKLKQRKMPEDVGIRDMDVSSPGFTLPTASASGILGLEGALKPSKPKSGTPTPTGDQLTAQFKEKMKEILNAPDEAISNGQQGLTKVAPPIYGCWHAKAGRVDDDTSTIQKWVNDLNIDPRNRAAAGLGTLVVRKEQDKLMASAWRQVSDIERINQILKQTQLAIEVSSKNINRIRALAVEDAVTLTIPVHAKIMIGVSKTIMQNFKESPIPEAALLAAFKQIARPRGPIRRRQKLVAGIEGREERHPPPRNVLSRLNYSEIVVAPRVTMPDKLADVDTVSDIFAMTSKHVVRTHVLAGKREADEIRFEKFADGIKSVRAIQLDAKWSYLTPRTTRAEAEEFRKAAEELLGSINDVAEEVAYNLHIDAKPVEINQIHSIISNELDPYVTIVGNLKSRLRVIRSIVNWDPQNYPDEPIMVGPTFLQPMYEALRDMSQDYLLPGLDKIPLDTISLLLPNQRFIEAYMIGLNHEMAREFLWRGYPTDKQGSYFRQFWDFRGSVSIDRAVPEEMMDIENIHTWKRDSQLGTHSPRKAAISAANKEDYIVLLIRGDVLRRYPNSAVYVVKAVKNGGGFNRKLASPEDLSNRKDPMFRGTLYPDITFFAFDLTEEDAKGNPNSPSPEGWYFIIQEQPGEPRFGLDAENGSEPFRQTIGNWDAVSWNSIVDSEEAFRQLVNIDIETNRPNTTATIDVKWAENSSNMAYILLQKRMRIAIHAQDMLPE